MIWLWGAALVLSVYLPFKPILDHEGERVGWWFARRAQRRAKCQRLMAEFEHRLMQEMRRPPN